MTVETNKNTKNKIAFKIEIPKKFLDKKKMISEKEVEDNIDDIVIKAIDMKSGKIIGKYNLSEYKLKFL